MQQVPITNRRGDSSASYKVARTSYPRARYYDQNSGRFISEDPIRFNAKQINFYSYVSNNPVRFADPAGTCPEPQGSVGAWHRGCFDQPTAKIRCACHCIYLGESCEKDCMNCFSSKTPLKPNELCKCMCKAAKLPDFLNRSCDSLCKDIK